MNKAIHFALYFLLIVGMSSDVLSKSSMSRSSSGSSFRRAAAPAPVRQAPTPKPAPVVKSTPAPAPATSTRPTTAIAATAVGATAVGAAVATTPDPTVKSTVNTTKPTTVSTTPARTSTGSTFKSTSSPATSKPKAVATSRVDKQKMKAMASRNKAATSQYGSKANAEKAFREKMAASNAFNSPTPPATRPACIPQTVVINNTSVTPSYDRLSNGRYAYGTYDPTTHLFIALAANQMMVNNAMMAESGYGHWRDDGRPYRSTPMSPAAVVFLVLIGTGVVIGLIVFAVKASK